jgi:hypothetical protein
VKSLLLALCLSAAAITAQAASPLAFYISDANGTTGAALPATYQFTPTAQGSASSLILKATNLSTSTLDLAQVFVANSAATVSQNLNFTITGFFSSGTLAPGASTIFTVNFSPLSTGTITGYLNFAYRLEINGCTASSPLTQCPSTIANAATLSGVATAAQLVLSYQSSAGPVVLQPNTVAPVQFGNVNACSSSSLTFTLKNQTSSAIATPSIALPPVANPNPANDSPFTLNTSGIPATIAANSAATFTITLTPGQSGVFTSTLTVGGSNNYPLQGSSSDPLQIYYVDQAKVQSTPQGTIHLDQLFSGALTFNVSNPVTSADAVTVPSIALTGSTFSLSGAPSGSTSLQPGQSLSFTLNFSAATPGTYSGMLSIGCRQFTLSGLAAMSPVPTFSLKLSAEPLTSQQQVNLTVQFATPATVQAIGTLTMQFAPSISNVTTDPAIVFAATNGRQLQLNVAAGAQTATYQGQSNIAFQTGTTAGVLTFTLAFPNTTTYTQSFTISPATIHITSASAVRQNPNLLFTLNGYDNTYSAGQLSFTFYDTSGKLITPNGIAVNALANFQQLFFTNNTGGGAFSMQASFPVTGDVTQVGSVAVTLNNSAGQVSSTQAFQ